MDPINRTKLSAHLSSTNAARALITMTLKSKGPMKLFELQRTVKIRRSVFLKGLAYLLEIEAVFVSGRGIKGGPLIYSVAPGKPCERKHTDRLRKRRLMIV